MQLRTPHVATIIVGGALIAAAVVASVPNSQERTQLNADKPVGSGELSLTPAKSEVAVGEEITLSIYADTGESDVTSGIDVIASYDPELLEMVDADGAQPGTQIKPGSLFSLTPANEVILASGLITFSAVQEPTSQPVNTRNGQVATLTFKAKAAGTSDVKFQFDAGSLADTNMVRAGGQAGDLLARVKNATITVK